VCYRSASPLTWKAQLMLKHRTASTDKPAGAMWLAALASGAVAGAALSGAGMANATCASISGVGNGNGCTSTATSFAVGIGTNAKATSDGLFNGALAIGDNS